MSGPTPIRLCRREPGRRRVLNSGQSCCGIERYLRRIADLHDRFVDAFAALTRQYKLGDPLDPATTLGRWCARRPRICAAADRRGGRARRRALIDPALFPAARDDFAYLAPQVLVASIIRCRSCAGELRPGYRHMKVAATTRLCG